MTRKKPPITSKPRTESGSTKFRAENNQDYNQQKPKTT
jgi:hypothetical protein